MEENSNKMTYQEFIELVRKEVHEKLHYDYGMMKLLKKGYKSDDAVLEKSIRNANRSFANENGSVLATDVLACRMDDHHVTTIAMIPIEIAYEVYKEEGLESLEEYLDEFKTQKNRVDSSIDPDAFYFHMSGSYEKIRSSLILRPLNYDAYAEELSQSVLIRYGDMALVLYMLVKDDEENGTLLTNRITHEDLVRWGVDDRRDEVLKEALANTCRLFPPCVCNMNTLQETDFLRGRFTRNDITNHYFILLSTFKGTNGAAALFYPGVIEKMMKLMHGPFIAVFMNTSDVMILDKNTAFLESALKTANCCPQFGESLSEMAFLCDERGVHPIE